MVGSPRSVIIAVDGPLASGKGTIARALGARFGVPHLDTGALYRAVAVAMIEKGLPPEDADAAEEVARTLDVNAIDEGKIRTAGAGVAASVVSAHPRVRAALLDVQRIFATQPGGAVLDGRDIGTVICPDADVKLFVTADEESRAWRRRAELVNRGEDISFEQVLGQLRQRDARDASRADAPMLKADDAIELDTSEMSVDEAVREAIRLVEEKLG
ncbi:MAG: cytidylate kinase [Oceanicaulis sp.]|uniref:(d)CMP kinase n=1 Tax=unclassified Oceanicaulis TaxID=2632123 RepID=UPI000C3F66FF|nr:MULTISPECIES: (d)CMP kinase [unclassified Oceanicaulis]MAB69215.1 cytidylate kinase [Oceanicaulis sp.]MBC37482.1 cytidylate kinase [Oceanicaulis sp.]MBG34225.1 cytidylate kinase [Oceanicaulis sp.]HBU63394.1 (d)CMP kinase [Oceanicaulis sp.]